MRSGVDSEGSLTATIFSAELIESAAGLPELVVRGDLDMVTAPQLAERVEELVSKELVVDLSAVTFMDSTGLRSLWTLRQNVSNRGGRLLLRTPSDAVMRVLKTTKLDKVFEYVDGGRPTSSAEN